MDIQNEIIQLQKEFEKLQKQRSKDEGAQESIMGELKNDFKIETNAGLIEAIENAREKEEGILEKLAEKHGKLQKEFEKIG